MSRALSDLTFLVNDFLAGPLSLGIASIGEPGMLVTDVEASIFQSAADYSITVVVRANIAGKRWEGSAPVSLAHEGPWAFECALEEVYEKLIASAQSAFRERASEMADAQDAST